MLRSSSQSLATVVNVLAVSDMFVITYSGPEALKSQGECDSAESSTVFVCPATCFASWAAFRDGVGYP